jgi:hypothetical protein
MDSQMNKATLPPRSFAPTYLATMEPKMSWRAYFRIVANFILSMVVAIIVGNLLADWYHRSCCPDAEGHSQRHQPHELIVDPLAKSEPAKTRLLAPAEAT